MPALTALDIVVILLVGGGAVLGILRGFVTEILSLFAWVAAILALKFFHPALAALLVGPVGTRAGAAVAAFAILFLVVFTGGKLVARALGRRTRQSVLGPLDRILGFGFGALKGLIGATLLFLGVTLVYDTLYGGAAARPDWIRDSRSYALLNASGKAIVDYVAARRQLDAKPARAEAN
ncbi:CvpA family protein [Sphingomonas montana]|uniref:CvpA family protein n=1 Tax=Sphingomonas montana TaxID=1843236 RepID=UPI00096E9E53|nr:CvpA family protein [Sphingomonas montana]